MLAATMIICLGTTPALQRVMFLDEGLKLGGHIRASEVRQCAAGKAVNAARVLRTLGESPTVLGFAGGDSGAFIEADLDASGVAHRFVHVADPTRTCYTLLDRAAATATELVESPTPVAQNNWNELAATLRELLPGARMLLLCGSLPPGARPQFYAQCIAAANEHNVPVIVDASGEPLRHALEAQPTIVKPNRAELAQTVGSPLDSPDSLRDAMRRLVGGGAAQWVVVTMGADGVAFAGKGETWRATVPRIRPVSAIGSGDSFTAGLAASILRGRDMTDAIRSAAACGISNALDPLPGQIRPDEVARLAEQVQIEAAP